MDGYALTRELRGARYALSTLMITAKDSMEDMEKDTDIRNVDAHIKKLRHKFMNHPDFELLTMRGLWSFCRGPSNVIVRQERGRKCSLPCPAGFKENFYFAAKGRTLQRRFMR